MLLSPVLFVNVKVIVSIHRFGFANPNRILIVYK